MSQQTASGRSSQRSQRAARAKAGLLANTCSASEDDLQRSLNRYALGEAFSVDLERYLYDVVKYRFGAITLVNEMVEKFGLRRQMKHKCRIWNEEAWNRERDANSYKLRWIRRLLEHHELAWAGTKNEGGYFCHPQSYLGAALFDSDLSDDAIKAIIKEMAVYYKERMELDESEQWFMVGRQPTEEAPDQVPDDLREDVVYVSDNEEPVLVSIEDGLSDFSE
ncbi:Fc.00g050810.m01.CDS01 [Cosmosporella sp. VM-42]